MKINKSNIFTVFILIAALCMITGCNTINTKAAATTTEQSTGLEFIAKYDDFKEYRDIETGVHYYVFEKDVINGGLGGVCPRYNPDGTLYTD